MYNKFSEANYGSKDASCSPEVGTYIMFLYEFACPNKKIRYGCMIASVDLSLCVHANGFIVLKLVATMLGKISSTFFRYFACSVNSA